MGPTARTERGLASKAHRDLETVTYTGNALRTQNSAAAAHAVVVDVSGCGIHPLALHPLASALYPLAYALNPLDYAPYAPRPALHRRANDGFRQFNLVHVKAGSAHLPAFRGN